MWPVLSHAPTRGHCQARDLGRCAPCSQGSRSCAGRYGEARPSHHYSCNCLSISCLEDLLHPARHPVYLWGPSRTVPEQHQRSKQGLSLLQGWGRPAKPHPGMAGWLNTRGSWHAGTHGHPSPGCPLSANHTALLKGKHIFTSGAS